MFEKHLWKSDILSKMQVDEMCFQQVFFKHFASINQLHGLSVKWNIGQKWVNKTNPHWSIP